MFAVLIGFVSTIAYAFSNLVDSHITNNLFKKSSIIVFYNTITNFIGLPFLFLFGTIHLPPWEIVPALIIVILICLLYQIPYYKALKQVDASISTALLQLGAVIIPFAAYFWLGDKLSNLQYIGFAIVVAAAVFLNLNFSAKIKLNHGFYLMILVSLMLAMRIVLYKYILDHLDWVSVVFYRIVLENILFSVMFLRSSFRREIAESFPVYLKNWRYFIANEFFDQVANFSGKYALSMLSSVVMASIRATRPIFVLLLAVLSCRLGCSAKIREQIYSRDLVRKLVCFVVMAVGVVLVVGK